MFGENALASLLISCRLMLTMQASPKSYPTAKKSGSGSGVVLAAFAANGTSAYAWARSSGWATRSVYAVIEQWIQHPERRGRLPLGGVYQAIARDLQKYLGADVVPLEEGGLRRPALERAA